MRKVNSPGLNSLKKIKQANENKHFFINHLKAP